MTDFSARYEETGAVTAGPMYDGNTYSGITEASRFWAVVEGWVADGNTIAPFEPYVPAPTVDAYSVAIQQLLDATAGERRYDSIQTAVTYRDDPNPQFASEAAALFAWRSAVWTYAYAELAKVEAGQRAVPTIADFLNELPLIDWP